MAKKDKLTFADRAKAILKKYPRAKSDKIERDALEQEMNALQQEQEAFRNAMGMNQEQQAFAGGGFFPNSLPLLNEFTGDNNTLVPFNFQEQSVKPLPKMTTTNATGTKMINKPVPTNISNAVADAVGLQKDLKIPSFDPPMSAIKSITPTGVTASNPLNSSELFQSEIPKIQGVNDTLTNAKGGTNEFLPSYIAAGANVAGNLAQMFLDKKPKPVSLPRYAPEEVDLTPQRLQVKRDADIARSISRTNARNLGLNAGTTMAVTGAADADIQRASNTAILNSLLAEEQANVGEANKAGMFNAEMGSKEALVNTELNEARNQRQMGYVAGAVQTIPDLMTDINRIKMQKDQWSKLSANERAQLMFLSSIYQNYTPLMENGRAVGTKVRK